MPEDLDMQQDKLQSNRSSVHDDHYAPITYISMIISIGLLWAWSCGFPSQFTELQVDRQLAAMIPTILLAAIGLEVLPGSFRVRCWLVLAGASYFIPIAPMVWR